MAQDTDITPGLINISRDCKLYCSSIFLSKNGCILILVITVTSSSVELVVSRPPTTDSNPRRSKKHWKPDMMPNMKRQYMVMFLQPSKIIYTTMEPMMAKMIPAKASPLRISPQA
eukprot:CAMPEP_0114679974 /NCGR_PEP_ID=MMETSP0191-20121206/53543_1 /TAXON_ID=126664 /ORGANISM="Sorites sp." /LENGTH=114 /DNA_ID=CAMNT_0001956051 /DNA_START=236 /DNA_END=580 /DNA_ORIENTATION=+